jgi:hypothetical protein
MAVCLCRSSWSYHISFTKNLLFRGVFLFNHVTEVLETLNVLAQIWRRGKGEKKFLGGKLNRKMERTVECTVEWIEIFRSKKIVCRGKARCGKIAWLRSSCVELKKSSNRPHPTPTQQFSGGGRNIFLSKLIPFLPWRVGAAGGRMTQSSVKYSRTFSIW